MRKPWGRTKTSKLGERTRGSPPTSYPATRSTQILLAANRAISAVKSFPNFPPSNFDQVSLGIGKTWPIYARRRLFLDNWQRWGIEITFDRYFFSRSLVLFDDIKVKNKNLEGEQNLDPFESIRNIR